MQKLDRGLVARAGGAIVARVIAGSVIGSVIGIAAYAGERTSGWLGTSAWSWLLLPWYSLVGAITCGYIGWVFGKRRAATMLLIDTGLVPELTQRALAGGNADLESGGSALVRWAKQLAAHLIAIAMAASGITGDAATSVTQQVNTKIRGWGNTRAIIAVVALAALLVIVPAMRR